MQTVSAGPTPTGDAVGLSLVLVCFLGIATFNVWLAVCTWRDAEHERRDIAYRNRRHCCDRCSELTVQQGPR
jgi:hypothetical protein